MFLPQCCLSHLYLLKDTTEVLEFILTPIDVDEASCKRQTNCWILMLLEKFNFYKCIGLSLFYILSFISDKSVRHLLID